MGKRQRMFLCLVRELGIEVEVNRKFDWLTNRITPSEEVLWRDLHRPRRRSGRYAVQTFLPANT